MNRYICSKKTISFSPFLGTCLPLQVDCNNYIRLLEFLDDGHIYVCGTYAFDPQCAFLVSQYACVLVFMGPFSCLSVWIYICVRYSEAVLCLMIWHISAHTHLLLHSHTFFLFYMFCCDFLEGVLSAKVTKAFSINEYNSSYNSRVNYSGILSMQPVE